MSTVQMPDEGHKRRDKARKVQYLISGIILLASVIVLALKNEPTWPYWIIFCIVDAWWNWTVFTDLK